MAALNRPTEATHTFHEHMTVNTSDREDHTFCGIMFPLECKDALPIERIVVTGISVRGQLGPMTVWTSDDPNETSAFNKKLKSTFKKQCVSSTSSSSTHSMTTRSRVAGRNQNYSNNNNNSHKDREPEKEKTRITANPNQWTKIYSKTLSPSISDYKELDLSDSPIHVKPGQVRGIYIHSSLPGDEAIVYDNYHSAFDKKSEMAEDSFICLLPAMAHVSIHPFGRRPIWGFGEAWRRDRKFVGRIHYAVVYKLWNPKEHLYFGERFQNLAVNLFACQRRFESPLSRLPDDCIFYILNMCKWDWMGDDSEGMVKWCEKRKKRSALKRKQQEQAEEVERNKKEETKMTEGEKNEEDMKPSSLPSHNHGIEEMSDDEYDMVNEDDKINEDDLEYDKDTDDDLEAWNGDSDEDDTHYDGAGPILYSEDMYEESAQRWTRTYRRQFIRHHMNNRRLVLGDFISAIMQVRNLTDEDGDRVVMMLQSDDDHDDGNDR